LVAPAVQLGSVDGGRFSMSTNEQAGELHKEAINLFLSKSLIEDKPGFRLAAAVVILLDAIVERDSKGEINSLREALLKEFPNYREELTINGVTHAEVYRFAELDEKLETAEQAISLLTDKPNG
jgi:hypothetical protein